MLVRAGFLLVRPVARPGWTDRSMPDRLVSLSSCLCPRFPDTWAITWCGWDDRAAILVQAARIGLPADRVDAARTWATASIGASFEYPGVFPTLDDARAVRDRWFPGDDDLHVLGVGLADTDVERFVDEVTPTQRPGFGTIAAPVAAELVVERRPLPDGGDLLGFEPMCSDGATSDPLGCSWLCNHLEVPVRDELRLVRNTHGLLATAEEGRRAADWIARPETGAEPGLWLPWGLVRYR